MSYYTDNREKILARNAAWAKNNKKKKNECNARWRNAHKEQAAEVVVRWQKANPERDLENKRRWRLAHPERVVDAKARHRGKNPERFTAIATATRRRWRKENQARDKANMAARRAAKRNATPEWADQDAIRAIYSEADQITKATGIEHHVDHSVPLKHPRVQGLHNEFNLQILTATANQSKSNRHWPDMWAQI